MIYYELPTELISRSCEVQQVIHQLECHSCSEVFAVFILSIFLNQANVNVTYISSIEKCVSHELLVNPSQQSYKRRPMSEGRWTFKRRLTICLTTVGHQTCSFVERFCQVMLKPFLENVSVKDTKRCKNCSPAPHPP